jgi:hypothetical protein
MKPILKEAKWGYNDMTETYVVELHILDENTGKDHYINLSEFYRYQRLYITTESIYDLMMGEITDEAQEKINACMERVYEPDKPNDYYDEFDHTGYRRSVKFACYLLGEFKSGAIIMQQEFIDEVTGANLNTVYIPDVEGFVYREKELELEEDAILEKETYKVQLDQDLEAIEAEMMVMMDGYPICLHASYLFDEQFYVAYSSMMAAIKASVEYAAPGDRVNAYFSAINSCEMIASYDSAPAARRSEYRKYFQMLSDMLSIA